jgi:hypothetical protein
MATIAKAAAPANPIKATQATNPIKATQATNPIKATQATQATNPIKATRIKKTTPQTAQLETFVSSLGVQFGTELYLCNQQVYLNADVIMPILSVQMKWFLQNSETPLHYIRIKTKTGTSGIYINKYGMTKLLGQSKEAVAFRLQDYIYELLYKMETQDSVSKEDLVSRTKFIKISEDLTMYQNAASKSAEESIELKESIESLRYDYANADSEREKLKNNVTTLQEYIKELESDVESYKTIANKLARYVRIKSKNPPNEAYDESLDVDADDDAEELDEATDLKITTDAIKARSKLKVYNKHILKRASDLANSRNTETKQLTNSTTGSSTTANSSSNANTSTNSSNTAITAKPATKPYTLLKSAIGDFADYRWALSDVACTDEFKSASMDYSAGETDTPPADMLWYADLVLSDEKRKMISLFLSLKDTLDESVISQLVY